ncbi:hypothetical protein ACIHJG_33070 [Streptomyces sp. NPDC052415]|uniref:hypothetical protein n=1 Tax=Streptomyces sp. NPDC052415 TaxID=3365690 RepID=UPI0037D1F35B
MLYETELGKLIAEVRADGGYVLIPRAEDLLPHDEFAYRRPQDSLGGAAMYTEPMLSSGALASTCRLASGSDHGLVV